MVEQKKSKIQKQKLLVYTSRPKNSFEPYLNPKDSPLGPQKVKNDPKIK